MLNNLKSGACWISNVRRLHKREPDGRIIDASCTASYVISRNHSCRWICRLGRRYRRHTFTFFVRKCVGLLNSVISCVNRADLAISWIPVGLAIRSIIYLIYRTRRGRNIIEKNKWNLFITSKFYPKSFLLIFNINSLCYNKRFTFISS